jgi:hypothetical protein
MCVCVCVQSAIHDPLNLSGHGHKLVQFEKHCAKFSAHCYTLFLCKCFLLVSCFSLPMPHTYLLSPILNSGTKLGSTDGPLSNDYVNAVGI